MYQITNSGGNWGSEQPLAAHSPNAYKEEKREYHWWTRCAAEFIGDFIFVSVAALPAEHFFRCLLVEFLGVFIFVAIGCLQAVAPAMAFQGGGLAVVTAALAHGITIFVLVATLGHISGGHFNPAVSLSVALSRKLPLLHLPAYIFSQLMGGIVGAFFVRLVVGKMNYEMIGGGTTLVDGSIHWWQAMIIEAFLTFVLCQTVLNSAVDTETNALAPLAIGFTLTLDILACGVLTGASMNPARSFGPAVVTSITTGIANSTIWKYHYVYWIGPACGAGIAALLYRFGLSRTHRMHFF